MMEANMAQYIYKTNCEIVKCVNCGNTEFAKRDPMNGVGPDSLVPHECERCHFISWFPGKFEPTERGCDTKE